MPPRSGGRVASTKRRAWPACWPTRHAPDIPSGFPPLERAQIVELACLEPIATGLHLTHWSSADLARQAVRDGIVPAISARTVRRILAAVDLQPHRTRYWRTGRIDAQFKARAEQVLWCYANAERLAGAGFWVLCADEMPNRQVLERRPIRRAVPRSIEQREFEYVRHGTVNLLTLLVVHNGWIDARCLDANDAAHYIPALERFRRAHCDEVRGVFLIHDGGPSHTAAATADYFASRDGWWRPRRTPARASWLNQSELLNNAFDHRYLRRGSWDSRDAYAAHVCAARREYNRRYAHPFEWTWSSHRMRRWYADHATR